MTTPRATSRPTPRPAGRWRRLLVRISAAVAAAHTASVPF